MSLDTSTTPTTALAILIPVEYRSRIDEVRSQSDSAFPRWMPHINFLFPFVPVAQFANVATRLQQITHIKAFELQLTEIGYFRRRRDVTFHLKPSVASKDHLNQIWAIIHKSLPEIQPQHSQFSPHLTLGQCSHAEFDQMQAKLTVWLGTGIIIPIKCLSVINRTMTDPFQIHTEINFN
jgi:poly(A) polymerase